MSRQKRRTLAVVILILVVLAVVSVVLNRAQTVTVDYDPEYSYADLDTGIRMAYVHLGDGTGTPVVLIHGATDSYISFSQVGTRLAALGYDVYIPELRGHGHTDKPMEDVYQVEEHAEDIDAFMTAVNLQDANIVGHSLGSFVAQDLAILFPQRVQSLTLIGSAAAVSDNPMVEWMLYGGDDFAGLVSYVDTLPEEFLRTWTESSNYDPAFVEATYQNAAEMPVYAWRSTFLAVDLDNTPLLWALEVPVLIIWGSDDVFFSESDQLLLRESLRSAAVTFLTKEGVGHNTHWEGNMGMEIAGDIDTFLKNNLLDAPSD
ncbi:MAG: alpha/beta hydrolase [Oscillospiraceae bacterium]|nr:alpha/beta hydrolase [Oscillospiraceae bacterium]